MLAHFIFCLNSHDVLASLMPFSISILLGKIVFLINIYDISFNGHD